jgi:hypothetical protein
MAAEVESLRSEFSSLLTKVNELRGEEGRISHRLKYQLEEQNNNSYETAIIRSP